jgi:RNA polymerase sigma-70 factor (ECF subfamily)
MMGGMSHPPETPTAASDLNRAPDPPDLGELFHQHRDRLRTMVALRMDPRVAGRLDPSDVVQESFVEAAQRYPEYTRSPTLSPYLWLRFLTMQRLLILHRRHLQTASRDAGREVSLEAPVLDISSAGLAQHLLDSGTSPSRTAARVEEAARLHEALEQLEPIDREILALRHFEQLGNEDAAGVLGIEPDAASQRYYRALNRLRDVLTLPGEQ